MKKISFLYFRCFFVSILLGCLVCLMLLALVIGSTLMFRLFAAAAGALALAGVCCVAYRWIYKPYMETERLLKLFVGGYTMQDIYNLRCPPSPGMAAALQKLKTMLDTHELITASKRQAQYLALQNQINPHFLYNTLEGIRGAAITAKLDNVANMTETLATFFRYNISNMDQLVTLEDELENIQCYYMLQQYRFGERIHLSVNCAEEDRELLYKCRLPKITLQPIVENAIIHGIEQKMDRGNIQIKLVSSAQRLIITVSDDGLGIDEARLKELNKKLGTAFYTYVEPSEEAGGIAIVNVNNRIQLLFGEEYGINIYSTKNVGTDVEITLPMITHREPLSQERGG